MDFASGLTLTLLSSNLFPLFPEAKIFDWDAEDEPELELNPPSNSQTSSSLPRVLTLTAFPLGVISAEETEDVWPHNLVPGVMVSDEAVEVQR